MNIDDKENTERKFTYNIRSILLVTLVERKVHINNTASNKYCAENIAPKALCLQVTIIAHTKAEKYVPSCTQHKNYRWQNAETKAQTRILM